MVRIGCVDGDGIGPELMDSTREILRAAAELDGVELSFGQESGGAGTYLATGEPLAPGALERFRTDYDAVLKGPVGLPEVRKPDGTEAGVLGGVLRNGLDTFANVRPVRLLPGVPGTAERIDYVLVRENTKGLYLSRGSGVRNEHAASDQLLMTRAGVERVVRFAFETARGRRGAPEDGVRRVTCVDKSNVLRSFAFFRDVFDEIAAAYPDIEAEHRYTDAAAHDLVADPGHFDVLVTENFVGDMLSDLGAATVGGLGMCPAANIGDAAAYFEPAHGSAPGIAGQDRANPISQVLSAVLLLEHLGLAGTANRIASAVESACADGAIRLTGGVPEGGTKAATAAITDRL
ncbi:isocitrate/isopropylmalate dehydrogenase family protein [Saccharopolyspora halophila]|uniref:Isocitrate/isopropylmalate dehydrogenase family protein n=1 Tax=Saccharopolyspora halophila TaxID=405551 RepID=A0ABP5TCN0_9PSEU